MRIVFLAGDLLNEKYNQVQGYTSQQDTFVEDFQKNIDDLLNNSAQERQLALESRTKKERDKHMSLANDLWFEAWKRQSQLRHKNEHDAKMKKDLEKNNQGILTENGKHPVLVSAIQTKPLIVSLKSTKDNGVFCKVQQTKFDMWLGGDTIK